MKTEIEEHSSSSAPTLGDKKSHQFSRTDRKRASPPSASVQSISEKKRAGESVFTGVAMKIGTLQPI